MMDENNRNFLLALVLSVIVLFAWQALFPMPDRTHQEQAQQQQQPPATQPNTVAPQPGTATAPATPVPGAAPSPAQQSAPSARRSLKEAIEATPHIAIDTPSLSGSISLEGARIDNLVLDKFKETVQPASDYVRLLSPPTGPSPYYVEHGWTVLANETAKTPNPQTIWTAESQGPLTATNPVKLVYDNGEGLIFRRTIAVDPEYMFTITQEVENKSQRSVTLYPYAMILRQGEPQTAGIYILHEGLIGAMGDEGLQEIKYKAALDSKLTTFKATSGWLGFTDKYWATALIPDQSAHYEARFEGGRDVSGEVFRTSYFLDQVTVAPGNKKTIAAKLFAGAKQVEVLDRYEDTLKIAKFEHLIDWGWFHFITKPLFYALDFFYRQLGNFGIAILIVTVLVKLAFFPLANRF